jgi:hypothetical protein
MWQLAGYRHGRLGEYPLPFHEPWATAQRAFVDALRSVESTINTRNNGRPRPYTAMLPSQISVSINV